MRCFLNTVRTISILIIIFLTLVINTHKSMASIAKVETVEPSLEYIGEALFLTRQNISSYPTYSLDCFDKLKVKLESIMSKSSRTQEETDFMMFGFPVELTKCSNSFM